MFGLNVRSFVCSTTWYVLAMVTCGTGAASAFGQIATSSAVSLTPTPVYLGQTPVATVTVAASDSSFPDSSVTCAIQARAHNASYATSLKNGVASIPLTTIAVSPVGLYTLACSYGGSPSYAASTAAPLTFNVINFSAWVINNNGTVSLLNYAGGVLGTQGTSGAAASAGGIAVDATGNAWAVTNTANSLVFVNRGASASSTFTGGGLLRPTSVAIDGAGQVWVANGGNSVSSFSNTGAAQSPVTGYGATAAAAPTPYNAPSSIAIDQAGSVWIANAGGNTVTRIFGSAAPVGAPLVTSTAKGTTGTKP